MSDKKQQDFSVDDIMNEYLTKNAKKERPKFDLDEILNFERKDTGNALEDESQEWAEPVSKPTQRAERPAKKVKAVVPAKAVRKEPKQFEVSIDSYDLPEEPIAIEPPIAPKAPSPITMDESPVAEIKPLRRSSGNTAIIEGLLKMKRERGNLPMNKTAQIPPVTRARINDIDLDIKAKIIPKTETIDFSEDATEEEKLRILNERRKKKIRDFVLENEDAEQGGSEGKSSVGDADISDFTDFEQAPNIQADIMALKGNLIIRLFFLFVTTVLSCYITFANDLGWPLIDALSSSSQPTTFLFINVILGLLSAFVCYTVLSAGLSKLFSLQADSDSLAALSLVGALVPAIIMITNNDLLQRHRVHIFIPVAILGLLFNTVGKLMIVNRAERNFKYVSGGYEKYALTPVTDEDTAAKFTKGALNDFPSLSTMRRTEFIDGFIRNSYSSDMSDSFCKVFVPAIIGAALVATLCAVLFGKNLAETNDYIFTALGTFSGTLAVCSAVSMMLVVNLPLARSSKKYLQSSGVILGYSAVDEFADTNSVLVDVSELFPEGMIDFVNLKSMSSTSIEESILVAASLACQANSIMTPTFYKMLRGKTEMLYPVESYIYEDGLGLSGWIENKRVLLGTRELMLNHSIEGIPPKTKEDEYAKENGLPLYLSISGVVTALFIVRAQASVGVAKWLQELEKNRITVILRSVDAMISLNFISEMFGITPNCLKLLPFRYHADYEKQTNYTPRVSTSMLCSGKFTSFAMLLVGTKKIQKASALGITFQIASATLGAIVSIILCMLSSFSEVTGTVAILYNLVWVALTAGTQFFKRV